MFDLTHPLRLFGLPAVLSLTALLIADPKIASADEAPAANRSIDYARDVLPILQTYCIGCHTADDPEGDLVLETFDGMAAGGKHGPAFNAGSPDSSRMLLMASGQLEPRMPPDDDPPSEAELAVLRAWIEQGAAGPDGHLPRRQLRTPQVQPAADLQRPITAVAISPDGQLRATAQFAQVQIEQPAAKAPAVLLADQPGKVNSLRFSADGQRLLVASGVTGLYGRAVIYRTDDGTMVQEMTGHRDTLYAAEFSPDGRYVATAGYDRDIILWDTASGRQIRVLQGHNGAVFDLAFSPGGELLASASADETVKIWQTATGQRLDTLPQPQGEVYAVTFTPDGSQIIASSADNQFRVWKVVSKDRPRINPLLVNRVADPSPLTNLAVTADGQSLIVVSQSGNAIVFDTQQWAPRGTLPPLGDTASDVAVYPDGRSAIFALMDGSIVERSLASLTAPAAEQDTALVPVYLEIDPVSTVSEAEYRKQQPAGASHAAPRGLSIDGVIEADGAGDGETDTFRFRALRGEVWMIETDAASIKSPLDTVVEVCDGETQQLVQRARLQATQESYFTFRGKDSNQSNDFRLFAWEDMELDQFLYAAGEVTRLWMYPRGPDSGFNVYPGAGRRWTYFGTSHVAHALGEPAYVVRPLADGEPPVANGLPVFTIPYQNDDDPMRAAGTDSRLLFTAPDDGDYLVRIRDTRGHGGPDFRYKLTVRPALPDFTASVDKLSKPIPRGAGREVTVRIGRLDGFDGPVQLSIQGLPAGVHATSPWTVQAGQETATAAIWADADAQLPTDPPIRPVVVARAEILGRTVERRAGDLGPLKLGDAPQVAVSILPAEPSSAETVSSGSEPWTLQIRPGETVKARVRVVRNGHEGQVSLGNETAGRNMPYGVFVDNIGLNGLLIVEDADQREFFITASPVAQPGRRPFHLQAAVDGGITSLPVMLEVVAK